MIAFYRLLVILSLLPTLVRSFTSRSSPDLVDADDLPTTRAQHREVVPLLGSFDSLQRLVSSAADTIKFYKKEPLSTSQEDGIRGRNLKKTKKNAVTIRMKSAGTDR